MEGSPGLGEALDAAALELLEALEELQQRRELLGQLLRQGWLSLSHARYSLGCHRVSSLQYGAAIAPRLRVLPRQEPGGAPRFEEVPGGDAEEPDPPRGGGDGLRQRRGPPEKGGAPPRAPPDPLSWFGVLVPPSLRQAQRSFSQGVTVAVELAGLQGAVTAAAARYRALVRRKRRLAGDVIAPPGDVIEPLGDVIGPPGDVIKTGGDAIEPPGDVETLDDITGDADITGDVGTHG
ncbi:coiled-coil domain-containing protein 115 [Cariama cristata]